MVKTNFTENQVAFDYTIYMIVGSYFKKAKFRNERTEKKLRFQYCEQKVSEQYLMEDKCISYTEKYLMTKLPESIWKYEVEVTTSVAADGSTRVLFVNPRFVLAVGGKYKGKKTSLLYELYVKKPTA